LKDKDSELMIIKNKIQLGQILEADKDNIHRINELNNLLNERDRNIEDLTKMKKFLQDINKDNKEAIDELVNEF